MTNSKLTNSRLSYKTTESNNQEEWMKRHNLKNYGVYRGKGRSNCLVQADYNLFSDIKSGVKKYFHTENISFWGGSSITPHTLSSQVQCLNFLFAIRKEQELVSQIAKLLLGSNDVKAVEIPEKVPANVGYISFEVTSSTDHLKEENTTRGANCTSIDALIVAEDSKGHRTLIPIEWKYTESYNNQDKSVGERGETRLQRYSELIDKSTNLVHKEGGYGHSLFFIEPFYQLMRQTLWAEQMIKYKETEAIKADDYMHIHVISPKNSSLLDKKYTHSNEVGMENAWNKEGLTADGRRKYRIVSQGLFLKLIENYRKESDGTNPFEELAKYLRDRYGKGF